MRWKAKPKPKIGNVRTKTSFAWLPVKADGYWIWLERVDKLQSYEKCFDSMMGWHERWVTKKLWQNK